MNTQSGKTVVVLGASPKPERYSNKAVVALLHHGADVIPVHPAVKEIEGLEVVAELGEIDEEVHTVTVYLSAARSSAVSDALIALSPKRVILNPGAENPELSSRLEQAGIEVEEACTLVLLASGQF